MTIHHSIPATEHNIIRWQMNRQIEHVMAVCNCSHEVAEEYLAAEEWDVQDAITSYKGDHK